MNGIRRPIRGKKILVASIGVATLAFAGCAVFPGCNLLAPPPCPDTGKYDCYEPADLANPPDGSSDGSSDGSTDGSSDAR